MRIKFRVPVPGTTKPTYPVGWRAGRPTSSQRVFQEILAFDLSKEIRFWQASDARFVASARYRAISTPSDFTQTHKAFM